ncbi:MAG: sensor histidine kinase [Aeromicrobium erythreum]
MPSLDDIARSQTALSDADLAWLRALVQDWQIIADLSFSDLVLWLPDAEERGRWAAAQIRPTTGQTTLVEDVVGSFVPGDRGHAFDRAMTGREVVDEPPGDTDRVQFVPVVRDRPIAVVECRTPAVGLRAASRLETAYRQSATDLVEMIRRGDFPVPGARTELSDSMRVGDGFVRTDSRGTVQFASPNAMSAYRRLGLAGDLVGTDLAEVTRSLLARRPGDGDTSLLLGGVELGEADVENADASLRVRVIPVRSHGRPAGSVVLLRDVTELRRRERQLVSKEATIREIHHRVKNNLQTVAALLRLQSRRVEAPEARAALEEAVQRVGSIALVHETLSRSFDETVDFDEIADSLLRTVLEVTGPGVRGQRIGSFGSVAGQVATPLAMVLTELVQNAAEHAFDDGRGRVTIAVNRIRDRLRLRVSDDGRGLPTDFDPDRSLGLSIVRTLVENELGGTLAFERPALGGTTVALTLAL